MNRKLAGTAQQQREADMFAMCLLMPKKLLIRDVVYVIHPTDTRQIEWLARRYQVDVGLMTLRLHQLGLLKLGDQFMAPKEKT